MWRIGFFDFNRATGFFGMVAISIAITLLVFSAIYFSEGAGWAGADDEEGEGYDDIAANWYMGGIIYAVIGSLLLVAGLVLIIVNKVAARKGRRGRRYPSNVPGHLRPRSHQRHTAPHHGTHWSHLHPERYTLQARGEDMGEHCNEAMAL